MSTLPRVPLLILLLFIVVPIAELYVIIRVGGAIGVLPTLAILVADSLIGAALLRSQGRAAWGRFRDALEHNRVPHKEVFDGAMVILGGALLLTPGFITDIFGIFLLLPPTRALVWRFAKRMVVARVAFGPRVAHWGYTTARDRRRPPGPGQAGPRPTGPQPGDIEGSGHEIPDDPPELPGERQ